jgi:GNAT superfamily N-acetyltransferase
MTEPMEFIRPQPTPERLTALTEADLQSLAEIMTAAFSAITAEDLATFVPMAIEADSADVLVSRSPEGKIVSAMVVNVSFCMGKLRGQIDNFATHDDHERQGHGGAVLDYALDWFRGYGVKRVELTSLSGSERQVAHRMYESRGFEKYDINNFQLVLF